MNNRARMSFLLSRNLVGKDWCNVRAERM